MIFCLSRRTCDDEWGMTGESRIRYALYVNPRPTTWKYVTESMQCRLTLWLRSNDSPNMWSCAQLIIVTHHWGQSSEREGLGWRHILSVQIHKSVPWNYASRIKFRSYGSNVCHAVACSECLASRIDKAGPGWAEGPFGNNQIEISHLTWLWQLSDLLRYLDKASVEEEYAHWDLHNGRWCQLLMKCESQCEQSYIFFTKVQILAPTSVPALSYSISPPSFDQFFLVNCSLRQG